MTAIRLAAHWTWHALRVPLLLLACLFVGHQAGSWHWPYGVRSVEVEPEAVHPGGTVGITTVRDYLDDCTLFYSRHLESVVRPSYAPVMLPEESGPTPWELNGKPHTVRFQVPDNFPCGSAQLRTAPAAACNLFQLYVWRMRQLDRITPFEVTCSGQGR